MLLVVEFAAVEFVVAAFFAGIEEELDVPVVADWLVPLVCCIEFTTP
jgi:hypothetical protein